MRVKNFLAALAATTLVAAPVAAAPTNSAQSLSVAKARVGTANAQGEKLGGGAGFLGLLIGAGVIAIVVIAVINGDGGGNSDSN